MFKKINVTQIDFKLKFDDEFALKPFVTTTFRGGVGYMLKKICCAQRLRQNCSGCMLFNTCAYSYFYEPSFVLKDQSDEIPSGFKKGFADSPRPYRIGFPRVLTENGLVWHIADKGNSITLPISFFGESASRLNYFILAIMELGKTGLGKNRTKFEIETISLPAMPALTSMPAPDTQPKTHIIYSSKNKNTIQMPDFSKINLFDYFKKKYHGLIVKSQFRFELKFRTPLRLRERGRSIDRPEFYQLTKSILTRAWAIYYIYHGHLQELDPNKLIEESKKVCAEKSNLKWNQLERYSTRQKQRMNLNGVSGKITFKINDNNLETLDKISTLLSLMKILGIGKSSVFGFGEIDINEPA